MLQAVTQAPATPWFPAAESPPFLCGLFTSNGHFTNQTGGTPVLHNSQTTAAAGERPAVLAGLRLPGAAVACRAAALAAWVAAPVRVRVEFRRPGVREWQ